jgi:hypothetical protein
MSEILSREAEGPAFYEEPRSLDLSA